VTAAVGGRGIERCLRWGEQRGGEGKEKKISGLFYSFHFEEFLIKEGEERGGIGVRVLSRLLCATRKRKKGKEKWEVLLVQKKRGREREKAITLRRVGGKREKG